MGNRPEYVIVDISDIRASIERTADLEISSVVYEAWFARMYSKAHSVGCTSGNILTTPCHNFNHQREALLRSQIKLAIDPLESLPIVPWMGHEGVWFFVNNDYLLMGSNRAIKFDRGSVYHRLPDVGY